MYKKIVALLASKRFFYAVVGLLVLESAWIALSGRYPMAFDEDFHLGIIKLYAHQWSPFFAAQPAGADMFGAVVRDPSYLQHYLLSFPYRLTMWLTNSQFITIIVLRFIGIGFMAGGLLIYRQVLGYSKASPAMVHAVLLLVVLTPVVPFLSAQINYDSLLFPVSGLVLLLALRFGTRLRAGRFDTTQLILLISTAMLASLVKYAYLPILCAVVVFVGLELRQAVAARHISLRRLWNDAKREVHQTSVRLRLSLAALLAVSAGLFGAMYGYNFVAYKTPVPECNQVIGAQRCTAYGAWYRNYQYAQTKGYVDPNPLTFTKQWANTYLTSTFFAVNGIYSGFIIGPPLPVLHIASIIVAILAVPLLIWAACRLWRQPALRLFMIAAAIYGTALWVQNYTEYINLGQHVAEHGRYWVHLLPAVYLLFALAVRELVRGNQRVLVAGLLAVLVLFSQGGGALTYIARSDATWWWQDNPMPWALNQTFKPFIKPWLIGSNRPNIEPWNLPQK